MTTTIDGDKIIDEIINNLNEKEKRLHKGLLNWQRDQDTEQADLIDELLIYELIDDYRTDQEKYGLFTGHRHHRSGIGKPESLINILKQFNFIHKEEYSEENLKDIYINRRSRSILIFIEGDIYLKVFKDNKSFRKELKRMYKYYKGDEN